MPAISTLSWAMVMAHAGTRTVATGGPPDTYFIGPEDCTIVVQKLTTDGLTIFLPGPSPGTRRPPDDGDWYIVVDDLGLLGQEGGPAPPTISGQGYSINSAGIFVVPSVPFAWVAFQFDAQNRDWILVQGGVA